MNNKKKLQLYFRAGDISGTWLQRTATSSEEKYIKLIQSAKEKYINFTRMIVHKSALKSNLSKSLNIFVKKKQRNGTSTNKNLNKKIGRRAEAGVPNWMYQTQNLFPFMAFFE